MIIITSKGLYNSEHIAAYSTVQGNSIAFIFASDPEREVSHICLPFKDRDETMKLLQEGLTFDFRTLDLSDRI